ncbi:MAG: hypothetical protein R2729_05195 [Bryobacteraceae bacterium]
MKGHGTILYVLAIVPELAGATMPVCVENRARLDRWTVEVFEQELQSALRTSGFEIRYGACENAVRVSIYAAAPEAADGALGAARREGDRILPEISVYSGPVGRLIGTGLPALLGKALARVAVHEFGHYVAQTPHHGSEGAMAAYVTGPRLMAGRTRDFLIH